jgi:hypothetical protein
VHNLQCQDLRKPNILKEKNCKVFGPKFLKNGSWNFKLCTKIEMLKVNVNLCTHEWEAKGFEWHNNFKTYPFVNYWKQCNRMELSTLCFNSPWIPFFQQIATWKTNDFPTKLAIKTISVPFVPNYVEGINGKQYVG